MSADLTDNSTTNRLLPERFWMRPVSFVGLLRVTQLASAYKGGLRAADLNQKITTENAYRTERGSPSVTTLYHCRNTLLRLGVLKRRASRYFVDTESNQVQALLSETIQNNTLSPAARDAFAELVLRNPDCRAAFFDLFTDGQERSPKEFRISGRSVMWKRAEQDSLRAVLLVNSASMRIVLSSPNEIKSVLYGVRYWARKELGLIDEFFRDDRGAIMYPIRHVDAHDLNVTTEEILSFINPSEEWTSLSLPDLAVSCCEHKHRSLDVLRAAIRQLTASFPGQIVTVPTSRAFATITASSRQREEFELRVYFRDSQNRYVSHLKMHKSLLERQQWRAI